MVFIPLKFIYVFTALKHVVGYRVIKPASVAC